MADETKNESLSGVELMREVAADLEQWGLGKDVRADVDEDVLDGLAGDERTEAAVAMYCCGFTDRFTERLHRICVFLEYRRQPELAERVNRGWVSVRKHLDDVSRMASGGFTDAVAQPVALAQVAARALGIDLREIAALFDGGATESDGEKEVRWDPKNTDYMQASEAVVKFTDGKLPLSTLSKMLKPDGPIRYMRSGHRRCKVHIGDFRTWAEKKHPPDAVAAEIADEWLADVAARKATERRRGSQK